MASLPYMQLYVADYLADTYHLTTEEHGAYMLMLMNYWQTGKALRYDRIPSVVRMDKKRFKEIENNLCDFFTIEDDLWVHERIEEDLKSVLNKSNKASESAKKRWQNKTSNANAEQTESHKDKIRQDKNIKKDTNVSKKSFTFTLPTKKYFDSLSEEYITNLKEYIENKQDRNLSFEKFRDQCLANGYKYKNFSLAYNSWNAKQHTGKRQPVSNSNIEIAKELLQEAVGL